MYPNPFNLQGGGNIQIGGISPQPQPSQTFQPQTSTNVLNDYTAPQTLAAVNAAPPLYYDSFGNTYGSQDAANATNQSVAAIDQSIAGVNSGIGRLPGQLNVGYGNIDSGYNRGVNSLNQSKATAQQGYDTTKTQQQQDFVER